METLGEGEPIDIVDNLFGPDLNPFVQDAEVCPITEAKAVVTRASEFFKSNNGLIEYMDPETKVIVRKFNVRGMDVFASKKVTLTSYDIELES